MKDGRWTAWYDTGQVEWEAEFKQDEKHGSWSRFYRDGTQASDGTYVDGKMDGRWISWFDNGKKSEEGKMSEGKNHGKWKYYDKLGRLKRTEKYDRGAKKSSKLVTPGGDVEDELIDGAEGRKDPRCEDGSTMFGAAPPSGTKEWCEKDGKKNGGYWEYWETGERLMEGEYTDGKRTGVWTEFYKNGNKTSMGSFENGRETGKWTFWYIEGQKRTEGEFEKGKKVGAWKEWTTGGLESTQNYR
jgi:antitoxin component YwqK of YwqJK toxin-antitoxin module